MATSVQCRAQERTLGMVMKEVDEDLAIFLKMRRGGEKERDQNHVHNHPEIFDQFNDSLIEKSPADATAEENFLSCENDTTDYDWFLSQSYPSLDENNVEDGKGNDLNPTELDSTPTDSPKDQASNNDSPELDSTPGDSPKDQDSQNNSSSSSSSRSSNSMNSSSAGNGSSSSSSSKGRKPTASRSATPTGRSHSRSLLPSAKTSSRSSAPTARSASSAPKTAPTKPKKPESARATSPAVKSRLSPGASVPKRPVSASRARPSAQHVRPPSTDTKQPRHRSCSPSRGQITRNNTSTLLLKSKGYKNDEDEVNPVVIGTKMVDRVVNMRKLAPPKSYDDGPQSKKSSLSQKSSSFGTSFSKKSLDMAIRHMDIRGSSRVAKKVSSAPAENGVGTDCREQPINQQPPEK